MVYPMCRIPTENKQLWSEVLHVLLEETKIYHIRTKTGKIEKKEIFSNLDIGQRLH